MLNVKKAYELKIIFITLSIILLIIPVVYGGEDTLRVPMGMRDMTGETLSQDEDLIALLASDDRNVIDAALEELDRIPDAGRVREIIEAVFEKYGLRLRLENYVLEHEVGSVEIISIETGAVIGRRPWIKPEKGNTLSFSHGSLILRSKYNFLGHRLLPMVHRWMMTLDPLKELSGYNIDVRTPNYSATRAWWRSGFPVTIKSVWKEEIVNSIDGITEDGTYEITGRFLSWEDRFVHGLATSDPERHVPWGSWGAYNVHNGLTGAPNFEKLLFLYNNPGAIADEFFCCLKASPEHPVIFYSHPVGLILEGESVYLNRLRSGMTGSRRQVYPFDMDDSERQGLIKEAAASKGENVDFEPRNYQKEIDLINARIAGVCLKGSDSSWEEWSASYNYGNLKSIALVMAMAVRDNLPIVFISPTIEHEQYERFYQAFRKFLQARKTIMYRLLDYEIDFVGIGINSEDDFVKVILKQVTPHPEAALSSVRGQLPDAPQTDL